jgi:threonine/homoserine/homoserine lactone efflux protein
LGIAAGNAAWGLSAGLGIGVLLSNNPGALGALRLAGAVCLTWLGARSLYRAWSLKRTGAANGPIPLPHTTVPRPATMLAEGAITNLLNPSVAVFYIATVPPFIGPGDRFAAAFFVLAAIHVTMALACHSAYALAFGRVAVALAARGRAWAMHAVTGAALLALAVLSLQAWL